MVNVAGSVLEVDVLESGVLRIGVLKVGVGLGAGCVKGFVVVGGGAIILETDDVA